MLILSLGSDVEVLKPESFRNEIKQCIENMTLKYNEKALKI